MLGTQLADDVDVYGVDMSSPGDRCLEKALEMARQLAILADEGEADCCDDSCAVLYGVIRDCAYRIRGRAEQERQHHRAGAVWNLS